MLFPIIVLCVLAYLIIGYLIRKLDYRYEWELFEELFEIPIKVCEQANIDLDEQTIMYASVIFWLPMILAYVVILIAGIFIVLFQHIRSRNLKQSQI